MVLESAFQTIFEQGCGINFKAVKENDRYQELRKRAQSLFLRYDSETDKGIALRAGVGLMGCLFDNHSERKALEIAANKESFLKPAIKHRALLQFLSESLISAAEDCLTDEMKHLAKEWKQAGAGRQKEIAEEIYRLLVSVDQREEVEIRTHNVHNQIRQHLADNRTDQQKVLPRQYGTWNREGNPANCQGKTQMLAAFARLADADMICISPSHQAREATDAIRHEVKEQLMEDMRERGITPEDTFADSLLAHDIHRSHEENYHTFHVCAALQVRDGSWLLIDPHALNFGELSEDYGVSDIYSQLCKYQEVLPGLNLMAKDPSGVSNAKHKADRKLEEVLEHSRVLEAAIPENPTVMDLANSLQETGEVEYILQNVTDAKTSNLDPQRKEFFAMVLAVGGQEKLQNAGFLMEKAHDRKFIEERINSALSSYHSIALNQVTRMFRDGGPLRHPAFSCSLPKPALALSALNYITEKESPEIDRFFLRHEPSQTHLYNAVINGIRNRQSEDGKKLGRIAAQLLAKKPTLHPLSEQALRRSRHKL